MAYLSYCIQCNVIIMIIVIITMIIIITIIIIAVIIEFSDNSAATPIFFFSVHNSCRVLSLPVATFILIEIIFLR